ncbi:MAG: glycerophosphoryl diester phosphodiesterase [Bacteroidia bacterium]
MHKLVGFISILILIFGCQAPEITSKIWVLGHAGAGFPSIINAHPFNSERSIHQALFLQGADGVEVDVQMSSDGHLVLFHDELLQTSTDAFGYVSNTTLRELIRAEYRGELDHNASNPIYTLQELVLVLKKNPGKILSINIHPQVEVMNYKQHGLLLAKALRSSLSKLAESTRIIIESPDLMHLTDIMALDTNNNFELYLDADLNQQSIDLSVQQGIDGIVSSVHKTSENWVRKAHDVGLVTVLYGLKIRSDVVQGLAMNPTMVQTDNIPLTIQYLRN